MKTEKKVLGKQKAITEADAAELRGWVLNISSRLAFYTGIAVTVVTLVLSGSGIGYWLYAKISKRFSEATQRIERLKGDIAKLERSQETIDRQWHEIQVTSISSSNMLSEARSLMRVVEQEKKILLECKREMDAHMASMITLPTNAQFTIEMDASSGNYRFEMGAGIPVRKLTGMHCSSTIMVPSDVLCLVKGKCQMTTFDVQSSLKTNIVFDLVGDYNTINYFQ